MTNSEKNQKYKFGEIMAILFASGESVALNRLAKFLGLNQKDLQNQLELLEDKVIENNLGLAFVYHHQSVQLVSANQYADLIIKFFNKQLDEKISQVSLETLAVVAYRGPISRAEIEYIRGVNCTFTLRNLAMRGLIEKKENPNDSRSYLYSASIDLVKNLGLKKIEDLPHFKELSQKKEDILSVKKIDESANKKELENEKGTNAN